MRTKHYLVLSGIVGGVIGSLLTASWVSPVTAQKYKFDTIQCSRLEVVDSMGMPRVALATNENGGVIDVGGKLVLTTIENSGYVGVSGTAGQSGLILHIDEYGVRLAAHGNGEGAAIMGINKYGNGVVGTWDKNGYRQ